MGGYFSDGWELIMFIHSERKWGKLILKFLEGMAPRTLVEDFALEEEGASCTVMEVR